MARCTKCNNIQSDELEFCIMCGSKMISLSSNNMCTFCGAINPESVNFCINCGSPISIPEDTQKIINENNSPKPKKKIKRKQILIITSIVVLMAISFAVIRVAIIPTINESANKDLLNIGAIKEKEVKLNPAAVPLSGTKEFRVSPTNGVYVSGEDNALDKERRFKGHHLDDEELKKVVDSFPYGERVVLDAYDIHAGLEEDEYFPGEIKISFDLEKMDIQKEMWPYLSVVRIGEDGQYEVLPTSVEENNVICLTNKNSVLVTTLLLGGLAAVSGYFVYDDLGEKYLWKFPEYRDTRWYQTTAIPNYSIYWPDGMKSHNLSEVKSMADRFNQVFVNHKIPTDKGIADGIIKRLKNETYKDYKQSLKTVLGKVFKDKEFLETLEKTSSLEWQRENVWPTEVKVVIDALEEADKYLFIKRGFKKPSHVIDIGILPEWPYEDKFIYGYSNNPKLASPYIHINTSSGIVPWLPEHLENHKLKARFQSSLDELHVTLVHELFHVVQNGYVPIDWSSYLWFWESTAVALEYEAQQYYLDEEIIKNKDIGTERNKYETLVNTLSYSDSWTRMKGNKELIRNQGYTSSDFLDYLRDQYYDNNEEDFIKDLLIRFSSTKDAVKVLIQQTSNSEIVFESDYRLYTRKNAEKLNNKMFSVLNKPKEQFHQLMAGKSYPLTEAKPFIDIKVEYNPLSTTMQYLDIKYDDNKYKEKDARLVLEKGEDDLLKTNNVYISVDQSDGKDFKFIGNEDYHIQKGLKNIPVNIQEIHSYSQVQGKNSKKSYRAYMMLKPDQPKLEIKDMKLIITLPEKGPLFKEGFVKKYMLLIEGPNKNTIMLDTDKKTEEIALSTTGDFTDWDNPKFKEKVSKAAKEYVEANPEFKEKLIKNMGQENLDKGTDSIKDLDIDYGVLNKAAEILNDAMAGNHGEKEYRVVAYEKAEGKTDVYGPPSDWGVLKTENESTGNIDIYGTWQGKVQITNEKVTITISKGKEGHDYTLTNSMYEAETGGGLMEFYGDDNKDGTVTFGKDGGFGFTLIKNSEKELYVTAPPMTLRRK